MQAPEASVEPTWRHYRVTHTLRIVARDEEAAEAVFNSYFAGDYIGGVQEETIEVVELDGQWNPIPKE